METITTKLYEGMFLVDSALAASDWEGVNENIKSILEKFGAEIVSLKKWDERKLAYPIRGKSRGTYILALFRVDGPKISEIERAVRLSDKITRMLILCVEDIDPEYIDKQPPVETVKYSQEQRPEPDSEPQNSIVDELEQDGDQEDIEQ